MKKAALIVLLLCIPVFAWANPFGYTVTNFENQSEQVESHLMRIDLSTGDYSDLGAVGFHSASSGLAFANDQLYAVGATDPGHASEEFWNLTTPPGSLIGAPIGQNSADGLDYDRTTGTMYMLSTWFMFEGLYSIDIATGASTLVAGSVVFTQYDGLAINSQGDIFAASFARDSLSQINLTGGSSISYTEIGSLGIPSSTSYCGLSFDELDRLWMLRDDGSIYRVDTSTGAATFIAQSVANNGGLAINPVVATPEPTTMLLICFGLIGLAGLRRKD